MKILTIIGARPQFIKAAVVSREIQNLSARYGISEEIIHTGQHFDWNMSRAFFDELAIPEPAMNLGVNQSGHGEMTGRMLIEIEREIEGRKPDAVLVYGDTNSTLAGALAAAKLNVPVGHVEAGLRSFNRKMPEEINRVLTDHLSTLLFCPTRAAIDNLKKEGIGNGQTESGFDQRVLWTGDVMYDAAITFGKIADQKSNILKQLDLTPDQYFLATVHRAENTDVPERLRGILQGLKALSENRPVVLPLHPRTRKCLEQLADDGSLNVFDADSGKLQLIDPMPFLDMVTLEKNASVILTDSGGVQKEAYFHSVPCVTLRDETEWVETVHAGWNRLAGANTDKIVAMAEGASRGRLIDDYGDGTAGKKIVQMLLDFL